jgi:hypothetical protein
LGGEGPKYVTVIESPVIALFDLTSVEVDCSSCLEKGVGKTSILSAGTPFSINRFFIEKLGVVIKLIILLLRARKSLLAKGEHAKNW